MVVINSSQTWYFARQSDFDGRNASPAKAISNVHCTLTGDEGCPIARSLSFLEITGRDTLSM